MDQEDGAKVIEATPRDLSKQGRRERAELMLVQFEAELVDTLQDLGASPFLPDNTI